MEDHNKPPSITSGANQIMNAGAMDLLTDKTPL